MEGVCEAGEPVSPRTQGPVRFRNLDSGRRTPSGVQGAACMRKGRSTRKTGPGYFRALLLSAVTSGSG
jgi:hypothetical protein